MTKPFKFRYVNEIVGGFVLLVVAALVAGVVLAGLSQSWFHPKFKVFVKFPPEGSAGIQKGADVVILGTTVGSVDQIVVNDNASMDGVLVVQGDFSRFIRQDSQAILKKKLGVAGDAFVEITKGSAAPLVNGILPQPAKRDTDLLEILQQILDQVRAAVLPVLEQARKAAEEYTGLAADLRKPDGQLNQLLKQIQAILDGIQKGEGTVGKILKDPTLINGVNGMITNLNTTVEGVNVTVRSVNDRLQQVQQILDDVKKTTGELPETMLQTQDTLREAEVLIEGIQKHWLLRSYVNQAAPSERISPGEVIAPNTGSEK